MPRKITLFMHETFGEKAREQGLTADQIHAAVGYAVTWGFHPWDDNNEETIDEVAISLTYEGEIGANYKRNGQQAFYMAGIPRKNDKQSYYSFHS